MSKLYVFGIGGTGARVLKSLVMLLSAGVDCGVDTIVPIIIDRDISNKDLSRTKLLIEDYVAVNKLNRANDTNKFFKTKISLLSGGLYLQLRDNAQKFADFIGKSTMNDENKALVEMLFSNKTLDLDMTEGFQGNPNIGSVVLNQFDESDVFVKFANDFKDGDKIFIISSIFGGTGASGFPLLRRILKTPNVKDGKGNTLPNWGLINDAPIGALSVLPYFIVGQANEESLVNSDTFIDKARAALSYYKTEDKKIDTLYYIADRHTTTYEHHRGGESQRNDAHFIELAGALAILDFVNPLKSEINFNRENNIIQHTTYKEFAIIKGGREIIFDQLADETKKLIINPLTRFLLFAKYMGYSVIEKDIDGNRKKVVERIDSFDIFKKEQKYQPYAKKFTGEFRQLDSIKKLESVQKKFVEWLLEMENQEHSFKPFNLMSPNCNDFIKGDLSILKFKDFPYKNWARVDNELNRHIGKIDKSLNNEECFLELFYIALEKLVNY
ncbi:MAG TPA: hypothetical protein PLK32_06900 [Defluviitoga tunisiensis]|nr:hypothetical protein [Defluviitoga tunisiensis]